MTDNGALVIAEKIVKRDLRLDDSGMLVGPDAVCRDEGQMTGASGAGFTYKGGHLVAQRRRFLGGDFIFARREFHFADVDDAVRALYYQVNLRALPVFGRPAAPFGFGSQDA